MLNSKDSCVYIIYIAHDKLLNKVITVLNFGEVINSCQNDTDATNTSSEVSLQGPDFQCVLARQTLRDHSPLRAMLMPA